MVKGQNTVQNSALTNALYMESIVNNCKTTLSYKELSLLFN